MNSKTLRTSSSVPAGFHSSKSPLRDTRPTLSTSASFEALRAAEIAFGQLHGRPAADQHFQGSQQPLSEDGKFSRIQSIRFAGPLAQTHGNVAITRNSVARPPQKSMSNSSDARMSDLEDLSENPEYVEHRVSSQPSSYRKLHKARSMLNPGASISSEQTRLFSKARGHSKGDSLASSISFDRSSGTTARQMRRSWSFLRGASEVLSVRVPSLVKNDEAVALARDRYLQDLHAQRIREQAERAQPRRVRRAAKVFRHSVRSSQGSSDPGKSLLSSEQSSPQNLGGKARAASNVFKRVVKRMLGRPRNEEESVPVQHLPASRPHYGDASDTTMPFSSTPPTPPTPSPEVGLLRRVGSQETVLCSPEQSLFGDVPPRSIRSVASEDNLSNQRSRVTSWTTSTPTNTIILPRHTERKRLSVIREDGGPNQLSIAHLRPKHDLPYAAFHQPAKFDHDDPAAALRIYSALQREIDQGRALQVDEADVQEVRADNESVIGNPFLSPTTSESPPLSSRAVTNAHDAAFEYAGPHPDSLIGLASEDSSHQAAWGMPDHSRGLGRRPRLVSKDETTPQRIADAHEDRLVVVKRPLRESSSGFFPRDVRIERQAPSPFKLATQVLRPTEPGDSNFSDDQEAHVHADQGLGYEQVRIGSAAISESVYSRTSGGRTPRLQSSSSSIIKRPAQDTQDKINLPTQETTIRRTNSSDSSVSVERSSSESSGQWKRYRALDVARGLHGNFGLDGIYNALPVGRRGHVREPAQFDEEDITIGKVPSTRTSIRQQTAITLARRQRSSTVESVSSDARIGSSSNLKLWRSSKASPQNHKENRPSPSTSVQSTKTITPLRNSSRQVTRLQRLRHITSRPRISARDLRFHQHQAASDETDSGSKGLSVADHNRLAMSLSPIQRGRDGGENSSGQESERSEIRMASEASVNGHAFL